MRFCFYLGGNMFKLYCRFYQLIIRMVSPFLKWREPTILHSYLELVNTLKARGKKQVLLVSDQGLAKINLYQPLVEILERNSISVTIYNETLPNPSISQVETAYQTYKQSGSQAIIGFGGGSPLDVAKVVAAKVSRPNKKIIKMRGILKIRRRIPLLIAIPTTSGTGSEATLAAVVVDEKSRTKYAINDPSLFPHYALLLPELTFGLPKNITAETGMDVLTHAVEAYIGKSNTKFTKTKAINATHLVFKYLLLAYREPGNHEARMMMQIASYDAGAAFTRAYVGNIHALSHPLSSFYGAPHGRTNATIMPIVLKEYGDKVYPKLADLARKAKVLNGDNDKEVARAFIEKIEELNQLMGIPKNIDLIKDEDILLLANHAFKEANPLYPVPVIFTKDIMSKMYLKIKGVN